MMSKQQIETIILQEDEIKRMKMRIRELERGYSVICRINDKLRRRIIILERQENKLNEVNV